MNSKKYTFFSKTNNYLFQNTFYLKWLVVRECIFDLIINQISSNLLALVNLRSGAALGKCPSRPNFSQFRAVVGKNGQNNSLAPHLGACVPSVKSRIRHP